MNILVTGGAGYVGSHLVRRLTEAGHMVVVYDSLVGGSADALCYGEELVVADLRDEDSVRSVFQRRKFDMVVHLAASTVAPESVAKPLDYYSNNTCSTLNVIRACIDNDVDKFVFSSTAAVYGMPKAGVADEEMVATPTNPYGSSKLASEWILKDAAIAYGLNYVILRYFNVAGAAPDARIGQRTPYATHLIKGCCQTALGMRPEVSIYGTDYETTDGTGVRDYIHVEDVVAAHSLSLDYLVDGKPSVVLNVGYGRGHSVREVIETVRRVSGTEFPVLEASRRPGDSAILIAAAERIRGVLGWSPRYGDLNQIVSDAYRWEKKLLTST